MTGHIRGFLTFGALLAAVHACSARTITLTTNDCDQLAVISAKVPRLGWACQLMSPGVYAVYNQIQLYPDMAVLLRFPLDRIPRDQRITKAEFYIDTPAMLDALGRFSRE